MFQGNPSAHASHLSSGVSVNYATPDVVPPDSTGVGWISIFHRRTHYNLFLSDRDMTISQQTGQERHWTGSRD